MFTSQHYLYFRTQWNLVDSLRDSLIPALVTIYPSSKPLPTSWFSSDISKVSTLRMKEEPEYEASMRAIETCTRFI
jgi:hypothetical protein